MASYGHVPTLDEAKAAFTLVLILMKCIATHVDFGLSRLAERAPSRLIQSKLSREANLSPKLEAHGARQ
jgi:hypothetical protein